MLRRFKMLGLVLFYLGLGAFCSVLGAYFGSLLKLPPGLASILSWSWYVMVTGLFWMKLASIGNE